MTGPRRKARSAAEIQLERVARRFDIRLGLAREMQRDGYLRLLPQDPEYEKWDKSPPLFWRRFLYAQAHYGLSLEKFVQIYNAGHIRAFGLDLQKATKRYMQRNQGQLSVLLLCHLDHEEMRDFDLRIRNEAALAVLAELKIDGKFDAPTHLEPYLDAASRGHSAPLERVARWMRDLIENTDDPHGWTFFGVRLALVEGSYGPVEYRIPSLRKWAKRKRLKGLLLKHPHLQGCVSKVPNPGRRQKFSYLFHRPGDYPYDL